MYFQNISVNPIISKILFFVTSHFGTLLSWCNSRCVNSTHHYHYTTALADSNIVVSMRVSLCSVFNLNNKNVNALFAREVSGFSYNLSLTMNWKFSIPKPRSLLVNSCR